MEKQPDEITLCTLDVVVMPNGEIISAGKSLGWFKDFRKYLCPGGRTGPAANNE